MLKTIITLAECVFFLIILTIGFYLFENHRAMSHARAFCAALHTGQTSAEVVALARKAQAVVWFSSPQLLKVTFRQSYPPPSCEISLRNNRVITQKITQQE